MRKFFKITMMVITSLAVVTFACGTFNLFPNSELIAFLTGLIGSVGGMLAVAPGVDGPGSMNNGGEQIGDGSDDIFEEDLNKTLVKVRPSETPLDTLTREIQNASPVESFEAGGWEVGTRDRSDTVSANTLQAATATIIPGKLDMWQINDVIAVRSILDSSGKPLTLLVTGKDSTKLTVKSVDRGNVPVLAANTPLLRLAPAVNEMVARTQSTTLNPTDRRNYCQIHMATVEESILHSLAKKKVAMNFSTYKEQTLWDLKTSMEFTNFFGGKGYTYDKDGKIVYTSDGVVSQIIYQSLFNKGGISNKEWTTIGRETFDTNNGSDQRFLFAGSGLVEIMSNVPDVQKQLVEGKVETVLGIKFRRIVTNFGEFLIKPMGTLFTGNDAYLGVVLDINHLRKYNFEPLQTKELDLDQTGQSRSKAVRIHENYCLFLENLPCHRLLKPADDSVVAGSRVFPVVTTLATPSTPVPSLRTNPDETLAFGNVLTTVGTDKDMDIIVVGENLTENLTVVCSGAGFSCDTASILKANANAVGGKKITVTFDPSAVQDYTGTIVIFGETDNVVKEISLTGAGVAA